MDSCLKKIFDSANGKASPIRLRIFFHDTPVGTLEKDEKFYTFEYDKDCPKNYRILFLEEDRPQSKYLHPFFTSRIPSRSRPGLAEHFERVGDDPLRILGEISSTSPISPYVFKIEEKIM